jgi:predicted phage tail protein
MGGCSLGIIIFIVNLFGGGEILGAVSSATLCGLCTVLVGMVLSLIIYAVAKSIAPRKKVDEWRMPVYEESEYVEYEEIIEEN